MQRTPKGDSTRWPSPREPSRIRSSSPAAGSSRPTCSSSTTRPTPRPPPARPTTRPRRSTRRRSRRPSPRSRSPATCPPTSAAGSCARSAPGSRPAARSSGASSRSRPGKPIRDAMVEVDRASLTFRLGAEEAERMTGEVIPLDLMPASKDRVGITRRFPIGPIAAISPFNFPLNLAAHKLAPGDRLRQPDRPQAAVQGPAHDARGRRDHRGGRRPRGFGLDPADDPRAG